LGLLLLGRYLGNESLIRLSVLSFPVYLTHNFLLNRLLQVMNSGVNFWVSEVLFLISAYILGFIFNFVFEKVAEIARKGYAACRSAKLFPRINILYGLQEDRDILEEPLSEV
jgi:peptidoglycan/LPS O-acetylase OafA/YrhL